MLKCVKKNTAVWLFEIKQKEKKEIDQCTGVHGDGAVETECVERLKETMLRMLGKCRSKAVRGLWLRITKFFEKE